MEATKTSEIHRKAKRYVANHYGNLLHAEDPLYDSNKYIVNFSVHYPRLIIDDTTMERTVNVLNLERIAHLTYTMDGSILDKPTREQCINALRDALNTWNERIERIVTKTASNELARVQTVHHFLNPIEVIMERINKLEIPHTVTPPA